jgi:plastocyanin
MIRMSFRRIAVATLAAGIVAVAGAASAMAQTIVKSDMQLTLNGSKLSYDQAYLIDDSLFVPYRAFAETIGAKVDWDGSSQRVTVQKGASTIQLTIGSTEATVDGHAAAMTAAAQLIDGSTFVPVRFLSEQFGIVVGYDDSTRTVSLTTSSSDAKHAYTVDISDFKFGPAELTVEAGSTVTFTNRDSVQHNAVAVDGSFKIPLLSENESATITLSTPGEYDYYCEPHKSFMKGKIIVK